MTDLDPDEIDDIIRYCDCPECGYPIIKNETAEIWVCQNKFCGKTYRHQYMIDTCLDNKGYDDEIS